MWGAARQGGVTRGECKMDLTGLLVQVISGAIGGSAAGAAAKDYSVGALGNAIAGAIGGGIVGQLIGTDKRSRAGSGTSAAARSAA